MGVSARIRENWTLQKLPIIRYKFFFHWEQQDEKDSNVYMYICCIMNSSGSTLRILHTHFRKLQLLLIDNFAISV